MTNDRPTSYVTAVTAEQAEALETLLSALPSLTRIVPHENGVLLNVTEDIPKTFLGTEEYGLEKVYFTQLSASTLEKRTETQKQQD